MDGEELVTAAVARATDTEWVDTVDDVGELRAVLAECLVSRGAVQAVGGAVVARLTRLGQSFGEIETHTGVPKATAHRWLTDHRQRAGKKRTA